MTQFELATGAGVGRTFISQIERGHFSVTLETIAAIAKALGVAPVALIRGDSGDHEAGAKPPAPYSIPASGRRFADRHG